MEENNVQNENVDTKTYTEKELQSYADKRVSEALKTARGKFEAEKKEAERLASMSAEERFNEEVNKRQAELDEREKKIAMLENKHTASQILAEKGISIALVDLVLADTAEDMNNRISLLEKEFNLCVQKEIENRLKGSTPTKVDNKGGLTPEAFRKLPLAEQQKLFMSNPDIYNKF